MMDELEQGSSLNLEQIWAMVRRGRWWIILPLFLCWITVWGVSWLVPTSYESEALILVDQQKVPEQFVMSNVNINIEERLQSLTQQVLSRQRLLAIINEFQLYPPQKGLQRLLQASDPVEQMRKDIKIDVVQPQGKPAELTAFKINYLATSPELAMAVNGRLADQFIKESTDSQRQQSVNTTSFLAEQVKHAEEDLRTKEQAVGEFKQKYMGDLPSQMQSNFEILSGLQSQLQNIQHASDAAKQQRLYLESQLQQLQAVQGAIGGDTGPSPLESLQKQLLIYKANLADQRSSHTEDYPDIVSLKGKITETEKLIKDMENTAAEKQKQPLDSSTDGTTSIPSAPLMQIRSQLKANQKEIDDYNVQQKRVESAISDYRKRLNTTPQIEQELEAKSRGYEEAKTNYTSLLQKKNQSELASNLESNSDTEHFRLLDPPSLPIKPKSPNHILLSLGGLVAGAIMGIGLLAIRELKNARVRHEDDLDGIVPAKILVRIPHLDTPREIRMRTASRLLETVAVLAMVIVIVVGNLYSFLKG
jgi:polysaccharide biosynthesis transport protein